MKNNKSIELQKNSIDNKIDTKQSEQNNPSNIQVDKPLSAGKQIPYKEQATQASERILSIDRFRGICMFLMVCSFILGTFQAFSPLAPLFEHYGHDGFEVLPEVTFADLFAPMFIFVIGLAMGISFKKRSSKYGATKAYTQLAIRFAALMGIGALLNGFEDGWADVFKGDATFSSLPPNMKVFAISFWIAIALVINLIVASCLKSQKYKKISKNTLSIFLAVNGIYCLITMVAVTGDRLTHTEGFKLDCIWDTLQNIGLAGLIALPLISFSKWGKLAIIISMYVLTSVFVQNGGFPISSSVIEGGIFSGFNWASILLFGSIFFDLKDDSKKYWVLTTLMLLVSVVFIISFDYTAQKRGCTPVFAMFTSTVAAIIWGGLNCLNNWKPKFDFLGIWGSNAITTYVVNYLIVGIILGGVFDKAISSLPLAAAISISIVLLALFTVGNWFLQKKKIYIRI